MNAITAKIAETVMTKDNAVVTDCELPQAPEPAGVDVTGRGQVVGRDAERLELGHQVRLVRQQVRRFVGDAIGVGDRGVGDQQALGPARAEALRQPEHPQRASGHGLSKG